VIAHPRLFAMQVLATAALAACVWLGFVVSAGADSLLTQALNVVLGLFGLDAIFVASAETVAGGIMLGLLLGAVVHIGTAAALTKALLTLVFTFVAAPVGSHILARSAHAAGLEQWDRTLSDELAEDQGDHPEDQ